MSDSLLQLENISLRFGGHKALSEVSFAINKGQLTSLIGPNGAGKTSLLNCIAGYYSPDSGRIHFQGMAITDKSPSEISSLGIARTFQNIELFHGLTVQENLLLGQNKYIQYGFISAVFNPFKVYQHEAESIDKVSEIMEKIGLSDYSKKNVSTLSYGLQKKVEVARALAMEPNIILLDEPLAGMTHAEKDDMVNTLKEISSERGIAMLLVEHDLGVVLRISDYIFAMDFGCLIGSGTPDTISSNKKVISSYIGE